MAIFASKYYFTNTIKRCITFQKCDYFIFYNTQTTLFICFKITLKYQSNLLFIENTMATLWHTRLHVIYANAKLMMLVAIIYQCTIFTEFSHPIRGKIPIFWLFTLHIKKYTVKQDDNVTSLVTKDKQRC